MKIKKRLAVFTFVIIVFLFIVLSNNEIMRSLRGIQSPDRDVSCYREHSSKNSLPGFDVLDEEMRLASGRNIFFHETSCFGEFGHAELNCRQSCAVESAARMNPDTLVHLLFLSPSPPSNRTNQMLEQLMSYENVEVRRVRVEDYIRNTPLERWYERGILKTSHWPRSHMSDIMRFLTLWRFGGIYLDLDVVVTASLEDLTDFAGAEDWDDIAAGVIGFGATRLGRRVADACIRDLMENFRGDVWGNNGPGVITRTLQKLCAVENVKDMNLNRCHGFKVMPPSVFYPVYYKEWKRYFSTDKFNETMNAIENARVIHVWNKLSASEVVEVGSDVPYALVAEKYCPRVYYNCGSIF